MRSPSSQQLALLVRGARTSWICRPGRQWACGACHMACFGAHPAVSMLSGLPRLQARASERQRGSASVHGPGDYWRVMRQASELAAMGGWPVD